MCRVCEHRNYEPYVASTDKAGHETHRLKWMNELLPINCKPDGTDYKIGDFTIYHCPTCGRRLF